MKLPFGFANLLGVTRDPSSTSPTNAVATLSDEYDGFTGTLWTSVISLTLV